MDAPYAEGGLLEHAAPGQRGIPAGHRQHPGHCREAQGTARRGPGGLRRRRHCPAVRRAPRGRRVLAQGLPGRARPRPAAVPRRRRTHDLTLVDSRSWESGIVTVRYRSVSPDLPAASGSGANQPRRNANSSTCRATAARSASITGPSRSTSRDTLGSTAPACRRRSAGRRPAVPPWAPMPGHEDTGRSSCVESTPRWPMVAPTTTPSEPSGSAAGVAPGEFVDDRLGHRPAVGERGRAGPAALGVGRQRRARTPRRRAARPASKAGCERADAEVRADRDRVDRERRGRVEVGLRVGGHRRADVAALDVEQHQRTGGPARGDGALQHGDAARAEPLEERRLRLDHRRRVGERLDAGRRRTAPARPASSASPHARAGRRAGRCRRTAGRASSSAAASRAPKVTTRCMPRHRARAPRSLGRRCA